MAKTKDLPPLMTMGARVDGYVAVEQAPVEFIQGSRTRSLEGHRIAGSWSDPWWLYSPKRGWAVGRHWKNPERQITEWKDEEPRQITVRARYELVIEPWAPQASAEDEAKVISFLEKQDWFETAACIAEATDVPVPEVRKVLRALEQAGRTGTRRGLSADEHRLIRKEKTDG